jgi:hypothetical protein
MVRVSLGSRLYQCATLELHIDVPLRSHEITCAPLKPTLWSQSCTCAVKLAKADVPKHMRPDIGFYTEITR